MATKKLSTYRLPEETRDLLKQLAIGDNRSESKIIELLVEAEAVRQGLVKVKKTLPQRIPVYSAVS